MPPKVQQTIRTRINEIIEQIGETPSSTLFDEADNYICALCEMERKPCLIHHKIKCAMMIKTGTELELLRLTDKIITNGNSVTCIQCGIEITKGALAANPLTELCITCSTKSQPTSYPKPQ